MPYFICVPGFATPYILDDEDAQFLSYFQTWGWGISEHYAATHPIILESVDLERKQHRPILYQVWEKEYRSRRHAEEKKAEEGLKSVRTMELKELSIHEEKLGFKDRMRLLFGLDRQRVERKAAKEMEGHKHGVYVNHLEDLQKSWIAKPISQNPVIRSHGV